MLRKRTVRERSRPPHASSMRTGVSMSAVSVIAISRLKVDVLNVDTTALRTKTLAVNAVLSGEKQCASDALARADHFIQTLHGLVADAKVPQFPKGGIEIAPAGS